MENISKIISVFKKISNIFLIVKTTSDEEERNIVEKINEKINKNNRFENKNIDIKIQNMTEDLNSNLFENHRILFYQTEIGKLALVRQLKPQLHIEHDLLTCSQIAPHIRYVILNNNDKIMCSNNIKNMKIISNIEELLSITIP